MLPLQDDLERTLTTVLAEYHLGATEQNLLLGLLTSFTRSISKYISMDNMTALVQDIVDDWLSNEQLLLLLKQQTAELDALKKLSLHFSSSLDLKTVLNAVASDVMALHPNTRNVHIFLYDPEEDKLTFGAALDRSGALDKSWAVPRPEGLTHTAARSGEIILVEDMQNHALYENAPSDWTGSILGLPLKIDQRVVGVMNISRSTTGKFINSDLKLLQLLADQAAVAISNARLHATVSQQAKHDTMTGLPNRRALDERLENEINSARRTGHSFATVMMDLDGFKKVNDSYGHLVGDQVLRVLFNYLAQGLRASDFLARYGGDELTLILSRTDLASAKLVTDKMHEKLAKFSFSLPDGKTLKVSMSGGIAVYPIHGQSAAQLLRAADAALYRAKKHHRGSFVIAKGATGSFN